MSKKNFSTAINEAIHQAMDVDESVICYGLGVTDPKSVFGTTANLEKRFGSERVFDVPTSENAMTGVAIGAALNGIKSVMTHQRIEGREPFRNISVHAVLNPCCMAIAA